ncbi:MAG: hypothetical protein PHF09_01545 [Candidatus Nanoarchaeia archaeon]|nr:hypothetical protein [Candidatus Nanoarchaeia archaeon]
MNKEDFIKILSSKYLFIILLLLLSSLFTLVYFSNKSFSPPEDELENPIIVTVGDQKIRLNDIFYLQELLLIEEEKNLSNFEAMEYIINEEILYINALENGFNLTDDEVKKTSEEKLNKDEFVYYKKYYIIAQYKNHILEKNKEKFEVTKEEAQDLFEFMKVNYPRNDYPSFEELELNLKEVLSRQKQVNFLDEYISKLKTNVKIEYIKDYILDDLSIYVPGMKKEEFYEIYYSDKETPSYENNTLVDY